MAVGDTFRTLYERDGTVRRRVRKELGSGLRVVVSDTEEHPDIKVFMEEQPDARVRGYHPETDQEFPSPETFTLSELPGYLDSIESVDVLVRMRELDSRVTSEDLYNDRIEQLVGVSVQAEAEIVEADEEVEDATEEEEEEELSD